MINKLNINDINRVNELGKELNTNFIKLFHIENLNNNEIIYTYKIENNVLGFIHIFDNIDNVEILNIVVDKKYRKQHIGSKLLGSKTPNDIAIAVIIMIIIVHN